MKIVDKIQDNDIKIIKVLYDDWKKTSNGKLTYESEDFNYQNLLQETGLPQNQLQSHLENLASFDFIEFKKDKIKLLSSGINYAVGYYDKMIH